MAPRKPNIRSKKRKFKKNAPPPRLSTAQIRRLTVDGEAVTDAPFVQDVLRSGRFKNVELGMKDMPAGYEEGGKVGKKKVDITKMSLEELDRYIQQLKEPLVVKPVKKNKGGGLNAAIKRVKKVQGMQEGGRTISDADRALLGTLLGGVGGRTISDADRQRAGALLGGRVPRKKSMGMKPKTKMGGRRQTSDSSIEEFLSSIGSDFPMPRGRSVTDIDRARIAAALGATDRQLMGMEEGGEVPKKFKGFSKLPEDVQQQMNPTLAAKYEDGGVVRGMGRAYRGAPRKVKIR